MKGKGHQGEHGAVYHFDAYPLWTTCEKCDIDRI